VRLWLSCRHGMVLLHCAEASWLIFWFLACNVTLSGPCATQVLEHIMLFHEVYVLEDLILLGQNTTTAVCVLGTSTHQVGWQVWSYQQSFVFRTMSTLFICFVVDVSCRTCIWMHVHYPMFWLWKTFKSLLSTMIMVDMNISHREPLHFERCLGFLLYWHLCSL
jgi:hypothetical protein